MNMRFKNVRDGDARFTRRLNVNIAVRARVKYRCDSFIIIADQIGKLSDPFGLNGFKNERHRRQSNAKQQQTSIRSRTTVRAKEILGRARGTRALPRILTEPLLRPVEDG